MRKLVVIAFGLMLACSNHMSAQAASQELVSTLCHRMSECENSVFMAAFKDETTCESKLQANVSSGDETCSNDQFNQCINDLSATSCTSIGIITLFGDKTGQPASCNGC
jgi:hypothetical protein